ncbi:hypothetical protein STTU_1998 [Streptomyces sp. Tu6071]|nr:hypothetical protein STTU_1998 [Streptomyces sp. Tu6071]
MDKWRERSDHSGRQVTDGVRRKQKGVFLMAGFLDRAKEQAQRGLAQGKQKYDDVQTQRTGSELLKKLGAAYYAERRGSGDPAATQRALEAVESHIVTHGDGFLPR